MAPGETQKVYNIVYSQAVRRAGKQAGGQAVRRAGGQAGRQAGRQVGRQAGRQGNPTYHSTAALDLLAAWGNELFTLIALYRYDFYNCSYQGECHRSDLLCRDPSYRPLLTNLDGSL